MTARRWVVEVSECRVLATARGAAWWSLFRLRMEPAGRITVITPSLGGDLVHVACDDQEHARWLAGHMHEHAGIPASTAKARAVAS